MPHGRIMVLFFCSCVAALLNVAVAQADVTAPTQTKIEELEKKVEALSSEVERLRIGKAFARPGESRYGLGPAASKVYQQESGLSIGGYGELKYENKEGATDLSDLYRVILYTGYKFNDHWVLNIEIEYEHVTELAVEFAYIDYLLREEINFRVGNVLIPMGLINELHEPTTYLSVDRPEVERRILPSTWHENGLGVFGSVGPLSYKAYLVNGLDAGRSEGGNNTVRSMRQDGALAKFDNVGGVVRLDFNLPKNLTVGGSFYGGHSGQDLEDLGGGSIGARTLIYETHLNWQNWGMSLRALAAWAHIADAARINAALGLTGNNSISSFMEGYYIEAGYDVLSQVASGQNQLIPFVRWSYLDTQVKVPQGYTRDLKNRRTEWVFGLNYKPLDQLVFKADYTLVDDQADALTNSFKLGVGYIF